MKLTPRQPRWEVGPLLSLVLIAALLHLPLLVVLVHILPADDEVAVTAFDASQEFSINLLTETEPPAPEPDKLEGQFVQLPRPEKQETPDEADFVDRYEDKVEEQTVRRADPGQQGALALIEEPMRLQPPSEPRHGPPQAQPDDAQDEKPEPRAQPEEVDESDDGAFASSEETQPEADGEDAQRAEVSSADGQPDSKEPGQDSAPMDTRKLFPGPGDPFFAEQSGDNGSLDYLRDISEGDKTLLNRKRTRYWAFFDRITNQIREEWSPQEEYRRRDPRGNVYGVKSRLTVLHITLDGHGSIYQIRLVRPSELDFLDEEAIRAVRKAAPFLNPPEGLKDQDGLIHFRFGFYHEFSTSRARSMRLRRLP